jgi:hypothetical protein
VFTAIPHISFSRGRLAPTFIQGQDKRITESITGLKETGGVAVGRGVRGKMPCPAWHVPPDRTPIPCVLPVSLRPANVYAVYPARNLDPAGTP